MAATHEETRHLLARYARLATLCRMKAESAQSETVARELGDLADAYDRRRLRSA